MSKLEPSTFEEALSCANARSWIAMNEYIESLKKNETWVLVPKGCKPIASKWVYKYKEGIPNVQEPRFKARLVAKGFTQRRGVDYNEIFSPMVKQTSIRMLLSLVAQQNPELKQLDVKTTFLHGYLTKTIYMNQPKGYQAKGKEDYYCLLKKSIYGLKQSPRCWNRRFDEFVLKIGFKKNSYDNCVYINPKSFKNYVYLL